MGQPDSSTDDFIVFGQPCLGREEIDAVVEVLESRWIGTGPRCRRFEEAFAALKGAEAALAVSSCTAALFLALAELGARPGGEVITTPVTFGATCNVIEHIGARPIFVDIDPATGNMDPHAVAEKVTERTAAILVVHLAGRPIDMAPIVELRDKHGIPIIEDCAHAISGAWQGQPLGTIGDASTFSFYATKNITTAEGGMLIMKDTARLDHCRRLSLHGLSADAWARYEGGKTQFRHFFVAEPGFKLNLTDLQAAIGLAQLDKLAAQHEFRRGLFARYNAALARLPLDVPPASAEGDAHGYHLYSPQLRLDEVEMSRDDLLDRLQRTGIGCGVHYLSLHLHPYYRDRYELAPDSLPEALAFSERTFSIPFSGCLPEPHVERVISGLVEILGGESET